MKYVINSSVGVKWVVPEIDNDKALRLRDDYVKGVHELLAPDVFPTEASHAIVRAERQGRVTAGQGILLLVDLLKTLPQLHPALPDLLPRAFAVASQVRIGIYDCLYVALAEREKCEFRRTTIGGGAGEIHMGWPASARENRV